MQSLMASQIFKGAWFFYDLVLLQSEKYMMAGKLFSWSILNGCSGLNCLSLEGFKCWRGIPFNKFAAVKELADSELKEIINALLKCMLPEEFEVVVGKYSDAIAQQGYAQIYIAKLSEREKIIESLLKQYYVYGVSSEIQQFFFWYEFNWKIWRHCHVKYVFV